MNELIKIIVMFSTLLNIKAFIYVIGGILSALFPVLINYFQIERDRDTIKKKANLDLQRDRNLINYYGNNIENHLDSFYQYKKIEIINETFKNAPQSLILLTLVGFFTQTNKEVYIYYTLVALIWFVFNELYTGTNINKSKINKVFIILFWIAFYVIYSLNDLPSTLNAIQK